jgi:hypothetical protein
VYETSEVIPPAAPTAPANAPAASSATDCPTSDITATSLVDRPARVPDMGALSVR